MSNARLATDGKFFKLDGRRFNFRGVTYGTFAPREDGSLFPEREHIKRDFAEISRAGFTVVRTYTVPPDDMIDVAADWGIKIFAGLFYPDWRYLVGSSRRERAAITRAARAEVRDAARRTASCEQIAAVCVGNEIPADAVRWVGTHEVADALRGLVEVVREEDPDVLVSYANFPTTEYLPLPTMDFLTFNVFLERQGAFRKYLTRLHHLAGDRPLVLGEIGFDAGRGEQVQAEAIDWQMSTAIERGVAGTCVFSWTDDWWVGGSKVDGWSFGLTRADRSPRQSLRVAERWNHKSIADLECSWPSISVVVCAHNAEDTISECLRHTCALDYPDLEVVVVDDGSIDATPEIVASYPRAKLVRIPHGGLSAARNAGFVAAKGDLIAYLDADAYPPPEWPYYLALGMDSSTVGCVGGPNIPPSDDPIGAHQVARAPGGPLHVLLSDDRAEHVPGCNMTAWKIVLEECGGFDPIYTAAGDDVDFCWKVLDRGWDIGFHPAAFVWHHRRDGWSSYLRQQRVYGRAEALLEARHPDRFTPLGTARWRGRIYDSFVQSPRRPRIYRGLYGSASYQSVYQAGGDWLNLVHQAGVPAAILALLTAPLAINHWMLAFPAIVALVFLVALGTVDFSRVFPPRFLKRGEMKFSLGVVTLQLVQPLVRLWGRWHAGLTARRDLPQQASVPGPLVQLRRGTIILPADRPRADFARAVIADLRREGLRVAGDTGWEDHDALILGSALVAAKLVTTSFPEGSLQLRLLRRLRLGSALLFVIGVVAAWAVNPVAGVLGTALMLADLGRGLWRTGPLIRRVIRTFSRINDG